MAQSTDETISREWETMLKTFYGIIDKNPNIESGNVKQDLVDLQEAAKLSPILTARQIQGIYDRCQNYIDGTYGKNLSVIPKQ